MMSLTSFRCATSVFAKRLHIASRFVALFLFPLAMIAAGAVFASIVMFDRLAVYWSFVAVTFLPFGSETGIPYGVGLGIHPVLIAATILWVNLWGTMFLVLNLQLLDRVPRLGPWIARREDKAKVFWGRHHKLRDLGLVGLGVFVMLPLPGTGAVPGSLLGRVGGFPWALTWLAVFLGSAVRVVFYTLVATGIRQWLT